MIPYSLRDDQWRSEKYNLSMTLPGRSITTIEKYGPGAIRAGAGGDLDELRYCWWTGSRYRNCCEDHDGQNGMHICVRVGKM